MGRRAKSTKGEAQATRAPAGTSPKDEGTKVRDLEKRLAEALEREAGAVERETAALGQLQTRDRELVESREQQAATSEILNVISRSPSDVQPVFDAIVKSAVRLCGGLFSIVLRFDGELIHFVAHHNFEPDALHAYRRWFPRRVADDHLVGRALVEQRVMNVADVTSEFRFVPGQREQGFRSVLFVPMVRQGVSIGLIGVSRTVVGAFPEHQVELLKAFADQAVIAIENVRLFNETKEALDRQTATSEILRVISSSPTDVQPVFEAILANALRLCNGGRAALFTFDGRLIHVGAFANVNAEGMELHRRRFPMEPDRSTTAGRAILNGGVVQIPDVLADPEYALTAEMQASDIRSNTSVPMLRDGRVVGTINIGRATPGPLSEREIAILQTFADQAVIAIDNVRLFNELQTSNRELTTALDKQ